MIGFLDLLPVIMNGFLKCKELISVEVNSAFSLKKKMNNKIMYTTTMKDEDSL